MIRRSCKLSQNNSFFLFGPRGAGKTTLIEEQFGPEDTVFLDLLDPDTFDSFMLDKRRFLAIIEQEKNRGKRVVIDEVQKLPELLDIVHAQIHKTKRQFVLTGSSSRRLKQKGTNLLAGRAWVYHLFPFSTQELGERFELAQCLQRGALPEAYLAGSAEDAREYLTAYVSTYLQKEIQEERWVRNLGPFRKFLAIIAQLNGHIVNKTKVASEVGVDDVTVDNYLEILEDTLIGFFLPSFHTSVRKAQRVAPKFYLIDPGIKRALDRSLSVPLQSGTSAWGDAFEHWVILEFKKLISYRRYDWELSYLRTKDDVEIDLIVDRPGMKRLLIEIKSSERIVERDAKALETLGKEVDPEAERWILSNDPVEQRFGGTVARFWREVFDELWS
jgi:predicted AAA+ superfamily ATPase